MYLRKIMVFIKFIVKNNNKDFCYNIWNICCCVICMVIGWICEFRICVSSFACLVEAICGVLYIFVDVSIFKGVVNGGYLGVRVWGGCGCI